MLFSSSWVSLLLLITWTAYASPIYDPINGILDGEHASISGVRGHLPTTAASAVIASARSETASGSATASASGSLHSASASAKSTTDKDQSTTKSEAAPVTTAITVDRGGTTHTYTDYHTSYRSHSLRAPSLTFTFSAPSYTPTPTKDAGSMATASETRAEAQQWKAIGVAVLSLAVVAVIVLGVYYWDKYRVVIRQIFCCGRKRGNDWAEQLEPEGNKAWEARIAGEDGHRYPTIGSLEEIEKAREKAGYGEAAGEKGQPAPAGGLPVPLHHGFEDSEHPLSPFFRRPSLRGQGQAPSTPRAVMMNPNTALL
ncbi:hypothetical protein EV121DRAFT_287213 [Schizophyllum commune]